MHLDRHQSGLWRQSCWANFRVGQSPSLPPNAKGVDLNEAKRVCQECPAIGLIPENDARSWVQPPFSLHLHQRQCSRARPDQETRLSSRIPIDAGKEAE